MKRASPAPESIGSILGQRLAERLVELSRPGLIIVDNSAVPVSEHAVSRQAPASDTARSQIAQAEARIKRYRLNRSKRGGPNPR